MQPVIFVYKYGCNQAEPSQALHVHAQVIYVLRLSSLVLVRALNYRAELELEKIFKLVLN